MKVLIAGDFCDRYRVSEKIKEGDYASLFDDVKPIVQSVDVSIVNFEFPIVLTEGMPIRKCGPNLRGQKESVNAIRYAGFNVCTLANNHILDQGEACCIDTKRSLEEAGFKTVGAGKNLMEASEILYIKKDMETLAVINCCEHEFSIASEISAGANPLNPIQQFYKIQEARKNADYVLVIVHGGHEDFQLPSPRMKEIYRFFVDAGADAVVNHHQHCYSGYEVYQGKPIMYGLGNFLFDDPSKRNCIWNEGYLFQLNLTKNGQFDFTLIPYRQCDSKPTVNLCDEEKKRLFDNQVECLNQIILDDKELEKSHVEWMDKTSINYELLFQPYNTRVGIGLFIRHLLPSFVTTRKRSKIVNYINCEAHLDRLRNSLNKQL